MKNFLPSPIERKKMVFEMLQPRLRRPNEDSREILAQMDEIFAQEEEFLNMIERIVAKFSESGEWMPAEIRKVGQKAVLSEMLTFFKDSTPKISFRDSEGKIIPVLTRAENGIKVLRNAILIRVLDAMTSETPDISAIKNETGKLLKTVVRIFEEVVFADHRKQVSENTITLEW